MADLQALREEVKLKRLRDEVRAKRSAASTVPAEAPVSEEVPLSTSIGRGLGSGATMGYAPEWTGVANTAGDALEDLYRKTGGQGTIPPAISTAMGLATVPAQIFTTLDNPMLPPKSVWMPLAQKLYPQLGENIATEERLSSEAFKAHPIASVISNIVGGLPLSLGAPSMKGPQFLRDIKKKKALQIADAGPQNLSPKSLEGYMGDIGANAYDTGIVRPWKTKNMMRKKADVLGKKGGQEMDVILQAADTQGAEVSAVTLGDRLQDNLIDFNRNAPTQAPALQVVENIIGDVVAEGDSLSTTGIQKLKGTFDKQSRWDSVIPENAFKAEKYRQASMASKDVINEEVGRVLGPGAVEKLNQARLAHGTGEEMSFLMNRAGGRDASAGAKLGISGALGKVVNPALVLSNQALGYGAHLAEQAPRALPAFGGLINQGGPPLAPKMQPIESNTVGYMVDKFPGALGPFGPVLQEASAKGGPSAVDATHKYLLQTDPNYGAFLGQMRMQLQNDPGARTTLRQAIEGDPNLTPSEKASQLSQLNSNNF